MKWMKARDFAEAWGVSPRVVARMCRDGVLKCKKVGCRWYVHSSELG